jgi:hypothetical protein
MSTFPPHFAVCDEASLTARDIGHTRLVNPLRAWRRSSLVMSRFALVMSAQPGDVAARW